RTHKRAAVYLIVSDDGDYTLGVRGCGDDHAEGFLLRVERYEMSLTLFREQRKQGFPADFQYLLGKDIRAVLCACQIKAVVFSKVKSVFRHEGQRYLQPFQRVNQFHFISDAGSVEAADEMWVALDTHIGCTRSE